MSTYTYEIYVKYNTPKKYTEEDVDFFEMAFETIYGLAEDMP